MNTSYLFKAFTIAISWNAFFYVIYKLFFVALTFVLYQKLPPFYFSQWATANSIIFLLLLWLNCGLKKSIPRFSPIFTKNGAFYKKFIHYLLLAKTGILLLGIPFLFLALRFFTPDLLFVPLVITLFVTEGICSLFLLLYHAHFYQKRFNLIQTFFLLIEMLINFTYLFFFFSTHHEIVGCMFMSKIIANSGIIIFSFYNISLVYKKMPATETQEHFHAHKEVFAFLKHSLIMWLTGIFQSFSERNFLFPFITGVQGIFIANTFKVVHDAALFFQRIPLKTVGIADTALLSCIEVSDTRPSVLRSAFVSIFKTLFLLSVPLICLGTFLFLKNQRLIDTETLTLFFIIIVCSSIELILSPYARILEIKLRYKAILLSYAPYAIGLGLLVWFYSQNQISLLAFISIMHLLRLLCILCMTLITKKAYQVTIPQLFSWTVLLVSLFLSFFMWLFL